MVSITSIGGGGSGPAFGSAFELVAAIERPLAAATLGSRPAITSEPS